MEPIHDRFRASPGKRCQRLLRYIGTHVPAQRFSERDYQWAGPAPHSEDQSCSVTCHPPELCEHRVFVGKVLETLLAHNDVKVPPRVSIEVADAPMHLSDLDLDRDLYYTNMRQSTALATYNNVAKLADNEFFCLGDNSPQSKDGRLWTTVNPWVEYHTRQGHKHLAPDGRKLPGVGTGIVPRQLMIGRAFFVYWPSGLRFSEEWLAIIPNVGRMRMIR